jgi:CRP/FNR family transcriptional regulator, cyclic AMP receptor protein
MRSLDDLLAAGAWAHELAADQLQRARSAIVTRDLEPGGYACHKGNQASAWVGVIDGLAKLVSVSCSGKSVTFAAVPAGSWFGEGSVLKREMRKYDVIALRESRVALMPDSAFWLLDTSISFNRFVLMQLNERLGQFMASFEHDRLADPEARMARALANMLHPQLYPGYARSIPLTQDELSSLALPPGRGSARRSRSWRSRADRSRLPDDYGSRHRWVAQSATSGPTPLTTVAGGTIPLEPC